jgi:hypothetical protein
MATTKTKTAKKAAPRKAAAKKEPATKAKAAMKSEANRKQPEAMAIDDERTNAPADECPKGGLHEWTDDGNGRFCKKCLEPVAAVKKDASVTPQPAKKHKAEQTGFAPQSQLDLEESTTLEAARSKKTAAKAPAKEPKTKKPKSDRKLSALDAAAKVLGESGQPRGTKEMIEAMAEKGYWTSPAGRTPHATLYAAILREISTKGKEARFQKVERGKFALAK